MTKGMKKYFKKKIFWFIITFIAAVILNFILPRLMPGDPVNSIVGKNISPGATQEQVQEQMAYYQHQFGLDKNIFGQFWDFVKNAFNGTFGVSYSQYPRLVSDIIGSSIWWTVALQLPAIIVGWLLGNLLGAMAAYKRSVYDKVLMPVTLFFSAIPAFGAAVILLVVFAVNLKIAPVNGAYDPGMIPAFNWKFISSVISHYQLPFWSIVLISIGGQAVGMRSMSIYELNADYVKYSRFLGIKDGKIVRYVFRNAMLPQVTGLAMSIGSSVGGALVAETIFSYPGLGTAMYNAIVSSDYPVISACTLIITLMVLIASFLLDIIYAFIDPRVKAAQFD
jgi:peptide/nickel transport system permease protein